MSSDTLPKEFVKTTEVLPIVTYGISSLEDLQKAEAEVRLLEKLKKAGLTADEVKLYRDNESGNLDQHLKIESSVLKQKLKDIYEKLSKYNDTEQRSLDVEEPTSTTHNTDVCAKVKDKPITIYPDLHPMNNLKEIEENLFEHLYDEAVTSTTKRKKALRRLERNKVRILAQEGRVQVPTTSTQTVNREGSLWDVKELPKINTDQSRSDSLPNDRPIMGPEPKPAMYTIKNNKIVRLDTPSGEQGNQVEECQAVDVLPNNSIQNNNIVRLEPAPREQVIQVEEFQAVDVLPNNTIQNNNVVRLEPPPVEQDVQVEVQAGDVVPDNTEEQLLEGTQMSVDDIRKIERFRNYDPGRPSKVLYLKNIAPSVSRDQLSLLFNQFVLANGGPVDVRLLTGRMRGQAFVHMQSEDVAIQALEEVNGTILGGRPVIAQFAKDPNRPDNEQDRNHLFQDDNDENIFEE